MAVFPGINLLHFFLDQLPLDGPPEHRDVVMKYVPYAQKTRIRQQTKRNEYRIERVDCPHQATDSES